MTIAEQVADRNRKTIKKAHNWRFKSKVMEYKIRYDGGISEQITIQGRRSEKEPFRYVNSFDAYTMTKAEEVIDHARSLLGL